MLILDDENKTLEMFLGSAPASNLTFMSSTCILGTNDSYNPINEYGVSTGVTAVTIVSAPNPVQTAQVKELIIRNPNTGNVVVNIQENDASAIILTLIISVTLSPGDHLIYNDEGGWYLLDSLGRIKSIANTPNLDGADGQLPNAKGTLYTFARPGRLIGVTYVSSDGVSYPCNLYLNKTGTSRRIIPRNQAVIDDMQYPFVADLQHTCPSGTLIEGDAGTAAKVDYVVSVELF